MKFSVVIAITIITVVASLTTVDIVPILNRHITLTVDQCTKPYRDRNNQIHKAKFNKLLGIAIE
jgi:hypothetical protein